MPTANPATGGGAENGAARRSSAREDTDDSADELRRSGDATQWRYARAQQVKDEAA